MKYKQFTKERDYALEKIFNNFRKKILEISGIHFLGCLDISSSNYLSIYYSDISRLYNRQIIDRIKNIINHNFDQMAVEISREIYKMNDIILNLSHTSEFEAVSRLKNKRNQTINKLKPKKSFDKIYSGVILSTSKTRNDFLISIERSYYNEDDPKEMKSRMRNAFPSTVKTKSKTLKKVREANVYSSKEKSITSDTIDDESWNTIVDMYKSEYIPKYRSVGKDGRFLKVDDETYAWEVEQEATRNFLEQVRDGQISAANKAGVDDFLWIAVQDHKTRFSHSQFDGLTSSEIKKNINTKWKGDERFDQDREYFGNGLCVAPSGFNCRCRSVPYTSDIDEKSNEFGSFDEWLME